jgi:hypothetical protein
MRNKLNTVLLTIGLTVVLTDNPPIIVSAREINTNENPIDSTKNISIEQKINMNPLIDTINKISDNLEKLKMRGVRKLDTLQYQQELLTEQLKIIEMFDNNK